MRTIFSRLNRWQRDPSENPIARPDTPPLEATPASQMLYWRRRAFSAEREVNRQADLAAYWQRMYNGLLTLQESLDYAQEETGYVFDDEHPNGVAETIPNSPEYLGEFPPNLPGEGADGWH